MKSFTFCKDRSLTRHVFRSLGCKVEFDTALESKCPFEEYEHLFLSSYYTYTDEQRDNLKGIYLKELQT